MSSKSIIRPLEGMRALAIISVLLFHVDFHFIPGGFLGVDLFFVISGFIISRILINEIEIGTFSFGNFYFKRFLRLFPALFLTLLVTLVVGYFVMTATPYAALGKSAIYTAASAANFNFWLESGYFDTDAHGKPLLHMWSLGVEEQFYLFWPALLVLFKGRFSRVTLILVLFILSLAASAYFSYRGYSAPFFMFPFRIYQFMLGAILAMMTFRLAGVGGSVLTLLAIIGFGLCCYFMSGKTDTTLAGFAAGMIGFALIVSHSSPIARYVLGNPVMFWIGQRSYVIYLVHWPLIVLYKYATDFELSLYEQFALLAGSLVLGEIVHYLIEAPFRMKSEAKRSWPDKIAVPVTSGLIVASVFLASHVWGMKGFAGAGATGDALEVVEIIGKLEEQATARSVAVRSGMCHLNKNNKFSNYDDEICAKINDRKRNVLIIGNSLAADTYMLLSENFTRPNYLQATAAGCMISLKPMPQYKQCEELNAHRLGKILELDLDEVILAASWGEEELAELPAIVELIRSKTDADIVLFGRRARFGKSVPLLLEENATTANFAEMATLTVNLYTEANTEMSTLADKLNIEFIDIAKVQCPDICPVVDNQRLFYRDAFHFTPEGSAYFAKELIDEYPDFTRRLARQK